MLAGGPQTIAGKAVSSCNAIKHGYCSTETLILASESEDEFKSSQSAWFRTYEPQLASEVNLVANSSKPTGSTSVPPER